MPACFWPEAAISRLWGLVEWVGPCWVHPSRCDDSRTPTVSQEPGAGQEPVAKAGATADPSSREIPRSRDCPNHTSNTVPQRFPTLLQRLDASLRLICAEKNRNSPSHRSQPSILRIIQPRLQLSRTSPLRRHHLQHAEFLAPSIYFSFAADPSCGNRRYISNTLAWNEGPWTFFLPAS